MTFPGHVGHLLLVSVTILIGLPSAAPARDPISLPEVSETFQAPYDAVWEATLKSLGAAKPFIAEKERGFIESDLFFYYFPFGSEASQSIMFSLAITLRRADAQHTAVWVQPRVFFMIYDGVLPGPTNNPWADFFARLRTNLGHAS